MHIRICNDKPLQRQQPEAANGVPVIRGELYAVFRFIDILIIRYKYLNQFWDNKYLFSGIFKCTQYTIYRYKAE